MKGYAKIKPNHSLAQRSTSKKEHSFLDQDVDQNTNETINDQLPSTIDDHDEKNKKKIEFFLEKLHDLERNEPRKKEGETNDNNIGSGILRRNFSVSSTVSKERYNGRMTSNFQQVDKQGSSKSMQGMVKRSFSLRKSSSVSGSSDKYCRIYDQPMRVDDHDFISNNNGENKKSNGKMKVGSKVVRACKRFFSIS